MTSIIDITDVELKKIVELEIPTKFFKYKAKDEILIFNKGFFLSLISKGSDYLRNKEWNQDYNEKEPVALLWHKIQSALGYDDSFEGRSLYYRMIINHGSIERANFVESDNKNGKRLNQNSKKNRK